MRNQEYKQRQSVLLCQVCAASIGAAWAWAEATVGTMDGACWHCGKATDTVMDCLVYGHHKLGLALAVPAYERTWDLQPNEVHQLHPARMGEEWRYLYVDADPFHPTWRTDIRGLQGKRVLFRCMGEPVAVAAVALVQSPDEREGDPGDYWSIEWPNDSETTAEDFWLRPFENRPWADSMERMRPGISELELSYLAHWMDDNERHPGVNYGFGLLRDLMFSKFGKAPGSWFVTDREARMVAMVIQWLGTNCGREFVERVLSDAGFLVVKRQALKTTSERIKEAIHSASSQELREAILSLNHTDKSSLRRILETA